MMWYDVVLGDLKKCGLLPEWHNFAHERAAWRALVKEATEDLNCSLEKKVNIESQMRGNLGGRGVPLQCSFVHL